MVGIVIVHIVSIKKVFSSAIFLFYFLVVFLFFFFLVFLFSLFFFFCFSFALLLLFLSVFSFSVCFLIFYFFLCFSCFSRWLGEWGKGRKCPQFWLGFPLSFLPQPQRDGPLLPSQPKGKGEKLPNRKGRERGARPANQEGVEGDHSTHKDVGGRRATATKSEKDTLQPTKHKEKKEKKQKKMKKKREKGEKRKKT